MAYSQEDWAELRAEMVREQLVDRGIKDKRVLVAMGRVPRHEFVPAEFKERAYQDRPWPIGPEQTISQPYVVAHMLESAGIKPGDKVLEVGTGSGYQTALLADISREVYSIELDPALAASAAERLAEMGYENVHIMAGDGYLGWPKQAPFDVIIVSAAPPEIPRELVRQLALSGRLIVPLGEEVQYLILIEKDEEGLTSRDLGRVRFVPMRHD